MIAVAYDASGQKVAQSDLATIGGLMRTLDSKHGYKLEFEHWFKYGMTAFEIHGKLDKRKLYTIRFEDAT